MYHFFFVMYPMTSAIGKIEPSSINTAMTINFPKASSGKNTLLRLLASPVQSLHKDVAALNICTGTFDAISGDDEYIVLNVLL